MIDNNELYHFGVKGMKWGVRRKRKKAAKSKGTRYFLYRKTGNDFRRNVEFISQRGKFP